MGGEHLSCPRRMWLVGPEKKKNKEERWRGGGGGAGPVVHRLGKSLLFNVEICWTSLTLHTANSLAAEDLPAE